MHYLPTAFFLRELCFSNFCLFLRAVIISSHLISSHVMSNFSRNKGSAAPSPFRLCVLLHTSEGFPPLHIFQVFLSREIRTTAFSAPGFNWMPNHSG